jgi:hypothetical protein
MAQCRRGNVEPNRSWDRGIRRGVYHAQTCKAVRRRALCGYRSGESRRAGGNPDRGDQPLPEAFEETRGLGPTNSCDVHRLPLA